jgi:hypothetical protein
LAVGDIALWLLLASIARFVTRVRRTPALREITDLLARGLRRQTPLGSINDERDEASK